MTLAIHINAGNSKNGNPRRGWFIFDSQGTCLDFIDEGFQGVDSLRESAYRNTVPSNISIDVEPRVYQAAYNQAYGSLPSVKSQTFSKRVRR
jgi:hypothetical protein